MPQTVLLHHHTGNLTRTLASAGVIATGVYVATVIYGGVLDPSYSHVAQPISALIQDGAPFKERLDTLFLVYNVLALIFAGGLFRHFARGRSSLALGSVMLAVTAIFGLVMKYFPMDPIGAAMTATGIGHLILASLMSLGTLAALLFFAIGLRHTPGWDGWSGFTWITLAFTAATGAVAALAAAQVWPTMGLWERLTIGAPLLWMLLVGFRLSRGA